MFFSQGPTQTEQGRWSEHLREILIALMVILCLPIGFTILFLLNHLNHIGALFAQLIF